VDVVVNKLDSVEPQEMPPLVYQLMLLSNSASLSSSRVLSAISEYYGTRLKGIMVEDEEVKESAQMESADLIGEFEYDLGPFEYTWYLQI
jgi:hypothetical protein